MIFLKSNNPHITSKQMEELSKFLQNNPYVVIIGFISTVLGIYSALPSRFQNALLIEIKIPLWVIVFVVLIIFSLLYVKSIKVENNENEVIKLEEIRGKDFGNESVVIDGKHFINCYFNNTELVYEGKAEFALTNNRINNLKIGFDKSSYLTLKTLSSFYADPAFRSAVETVFQGIRDNSLGKRTPDNKSK